MFLAALEDQLQLLELLRGVIRRAKARGGLLVFARVAIARLPPGALDNALRGEGDEAQVSVRRQRSKVALAVAMLGTGLRDLDLTQQCIGSARASEA